MIKKKTTKKSQPIAMGLGFNLPDVASAYIAGTFNDWNPTATPLQHDGNGSWKATVLLPPGRYEYRLVADGQWINAPGLHAVVENPFGSRNTVLTVPSP